MSSGGHNVLLCACGHPKTAHGVRGYCGKYGRGECHEAFCPCHFYRHDPKAVRKPRPVPPPKLNENGTPYVAPCRCDSAECMECLIRAMRARHRARRAA